MGRNLHPIITLLLCMLLLTAGCARNTGRHGVPFDLDKLFTGRRATTPESSKDKGIRLAKAGEFDQAIQAFTEYVIQEPEDYFGFNAIAVCHKNLGDHTKAMQNFERALEFADTSEERAKVQANIGNLYFAADKPQVALGYYKEAAAEFEKNPLYLILIARTFVVLDEYDRARKVLVAAEEMHNNLDKYERDDERGLGYYLMAQTYAALNEEEKVFHRLEAAMRANPLRYVRRVEKDVADEKSLLYTLKDDPRLKKALRQYAAKASPTSWFGLD